MDIDPIATFSSFKLDNDPVRVVWVTWTLFVVLSSLCGDTLILVASTKYKAFKLNKLTVTFIQHLAVSDLILAVTYVLPTFASLIANKWPFGPTSCFIQIYPVWLCAQLSMNLVCGMTTSKILQLTYPLQARSWTKKAAHKVCAGIWLLSFYYPVCFLVIDPKDASFDYRVYFCNPSLSSATWKVVMPVSFILFGAIPNLIIIITTILILVKARRAVRSYKKKRSLKWQGIMTVLFTASAYLVAYLPVTVYFIAAPFVSQGWFHFHYHRVAVSLTHTNIMANFFIYSLTVASFRTFLKKVFAVLSFNYTSLNKGNNIESVKNTFNLVLIFFSKKLTHFF